MIRDIEVAFHEWTSQHVLRAPRYKGLRDDKPAHEPITTVDPEIPVDHLEVWVKPLTRSELQVEADAWFELLRQKSRQIAAARLGVKMTNEALTAADSAVISPDEALSSMCLCSGSGRPTS